MKKSISSWMALLLTAFLVVTGIFLFEGSMVAQQRTGSAVDARPETTPSPSSSPSQGDSSATDKSDKDLLLENYDTGMGSALDKQMFYDARTIGMSQDFERSFFEGDVVAIGAGSIISADHVEVDKKRNIVMAKGHVVILTPNQLFTGDEVEFHTLTGDFKVTQAIMIVNDKKEVARISNELLGFSAAEVEFENAKKARIGELEAKKTYLRNQYRKDVKEDPGTLPPDNLVNAYALTIEEQDLTAAQPNPAFTDMSVKHRKNFIKRREFWEKSRLAAGGGALSENIYFKVTGESISRTNGNDYLAYDAIWTPCRCDEDESPAWGFHSEKITAQMGGYVDLYHPVLKIKGIPVLYLPYLKLPLKSKRQSGFLMPSFRAGTSQVDSVFTQPVYFDFADNFDSTFTTDLFLDRGTRLGAETRYAFREHSGFTLNVETIRDREWIQDRDVRDELLSTYFNPKARYCNQANPVARSACEQTVRGRMAAPDNTWRGMQEWQGQYFLAPRLSFVSRGTVTSDHRYIEDLSLNDAFVEALSPNMHAVSFSTAKAQFHLDGKEYYLGLGTRYGDQVLSDQRFSGLQVPARLSFQSRTFDVDRFHVLPLPLYGQMAVQQFDIATFQSLPAANPDNPQIQLGDGTWRSVSFGTVSPIVTKSIVTVNHFADAQAREITHKGLPTSSSDIRSWRTGFNFNLPIDGSGPLPMAFQPDDWAEEGKGKLYVHHLMNWGVTYSIRPVVVRRGSYAGLDESPPLTYFDSDRKVYNTDSAVPVEETMVNHQRITLYTNQRWKNYRGLFQLFHDDKAAPIAVGDDAAIAPPKSETVRERSRRELQESLNFPYDISEDMGTVVNGKKVYQKGMKTYELKEVDAIEPVNMNANITYDFEQEKLRHQQIENNQRIAGSASPTDPRIIPYPNLAEPWSGPNMDLTLNWAGYTLTNIMTYNLYTRYATTVRFALGLPAFWATTLGFGYDFEKLPVYDTVADIQSSKTTIVRSVTATSTVIPRITLLLSLFRKTVLDTPDGNQYETRYGVQYLSDSNCWGLRFLRSKDYNQNEENAAYLLQLSIVFMGDQRPVDVSPQLERQLPHHQGT